MSYKPYEVFPLMVRWQSSLTGKVFCVWECQHCAHVNTWSELWEEANSHVIARREKWLAEWRRTR